MGPAFKTCTKCKKNKSIEDFFKDSGKKDGLEFSCKSCKMAARAKNSPGSFKHRYYRMRVKAKERGINVEINLQQYIELSGDRSCYYCDASTAEETGGALNRIDNNKGYTYKNLISCCKICNRLMSNFTKEQLKSRLIKIHHRLGNEQDFKSKQKQDKKGDPKK